MPSQATNLPLPATSITVTAGEDLQAAFLEIDKQVQRKIARKALRIGDVPIVDAMRSLIVDRSGLLAGSLSMRPGKGDRKGITSMLISANATAEAFATAREGQGKLSAAAGVRKRYANRMSATYVVFYARMVEFGHKGPYGSPASTPEHSFARAGFDATVDDAADKIEDSLISGIEEVWEKAAVKQ
jgi:hypothetical protein